MKYLIKSISVIILFTILITSVPIVSSAASYTDITNHWAKKHILYVTGKGVMNDYTGQFKPNEYVKRADAVKYLYDFLYAIPKTNDDHPFFNEITEKYEDAVRWAHSNQIVFGKSDGTFGANDNIKRQDMFVIIYNAYDAYGIGFEQSKPGAYYKEYNSTQSYAKDKILALYRQLIVQGDDSGAVTPTAYLTRAQLAVVFYQLYHTIYFCPVDALHQSSSYWCWAFAGNMVGSYHYVSPPITTSTIVYRVKGKDNVPMTEGGDINDTINAARIASNYTKNYAATGGIVSDSSLVSRILSHKPFISASRTGINGLGHAMVICGFSYKKINNTTTFSVIFVNPNSIDYEMVPYATFVNGYNSMIWVDSICQS